MFYKVLYSAIAIYYGYVSYTGTAFWNTSKTAKKISPTERRAYHK